MHATSVFWACACNNEVVMIFKNCPTSFTDDTNNQGQCFQHRRRKKDKDAQMVEHSSCNEGAVMRVENVKQSNSASIIRLDSSPPLTTI